MAIEANPGAAFLAAYQVGDASQRAWQEIAMRQQEQRRLETQQIRAALQQRVENQREQQAFDFKRQLEVLRDARQTREDERLAAYQAAQARTGQINAATSRYEAIIRERQLRNQGRSLGDPYGLGGAAGDMSVPSLDIPPVSDTPGGFAFGGRRYAGDWGPSGVSVFGGPNDPDDNGLSAFGGRTGAGGREGVAVPESVLRQTLGNNRKAWENAGVAVTLADGTTKTLPVADLGTAERIWERNGGPVLDMTPGALESLGGQVIYDRNGQQQGARGIEIANVRVVPSAAQEMVPAAAAVPPDLSVPSVTPDDWIPPQEAVVRTAAADLPVPEVVPQAADTQLLPPPVETPSIGSADLTRGLSDQLFQLQRDNRRLAVEGAQAKTYATGLQRTMRGVRPDLKDTYQQEIAQANATARNAEAQEFAASRELARREKELPLLQKRQDALTGLTALDGVLPPQEVQTLIREAGDIRTGGAADRKINVLSAYGKVREQQGLTYPSRGLSTAEQVARTGAQLVSPEGIKARDAAETYAALQRRLADDAANPMDTKTKESYNKDLLKATAGSEKWQRMQQQFQQAVLNDQAVVPGVDEVSPTPAPAAPAVRDIFAAGTTPQMSQPAQEEWSSAKESVLGKLGGMQGVQSRLGAVKNLDEFKQQLRAQVWAAVRPPGALGEPGDERGELEPGELGLTRLPQNAQLTEDVVDALAEDIWKATGRGVGDKVVAGSPGISPEGRVKAQELLQKLSK